ncbi:MAG: cation-translocating P-type ATPase [Acidimicrobiales bacterium]
MRKELRTSVASGTVPRNRTRRGVSRNGTFVTTASGRPVRGGAGARACRPLAGETFSRPLEELVSVLSPDPVRSTPPGGPPPGLDPAEAARRLERDGPNRLPEAPPRSRLATFADQFRNLLVGILAVAAVLAGLVGDWKDTVVIAVVLLINGVLGYVQERRAESSLAALKRMLVASATVRRGGELQVVPAEDLVAGDVVVVEAGARVPADGRLLVAESLEVDESSLTGESLPVSKSTTPVLDGTALGDRTDLVFMNTVVTRGRAEVEVTATGARTEIGALAGMLAADDGSETPLQEQLRALGTRLAMVAGVAVAAYLALSLLRGEPLDEVVLSSVALAVAAIPEGLPAVVTVTLAVGVHQLAKRGAIVKRLASVETLGSTTVICSDKTGTLTCNEMTAEVVEPAPGHDEREVLRLAALCSDAEVRDGVLVGEPTEGAVVRRAVDVGLDVAAERAAAPRVGEVPFESATKLMATIHPAGDDLLVVVKGAPDVVAPQAAEQVEALAAQGLRVLAVASARVPAATAPADGWMVDDLPMADLELVGLVGLVDPPRPGVREAIATCHRAGIDVRMITGDHAATATAIAQRLGIRGATMTGAQLDELAHPSPEELGAEVADVRVFARVAPVHKVRLVEALRAQGHVVAMTGDGVNDAPALKRADIGVAMGITGTEVTKEAADLVLADDDFRTIVRAVEAGRTIYTNIVTFVRFQLSTNVGAILTMLGALVVGLPAPFSAVQVLWVNLIMDGPPAMALGVDPPSGRAMERAPRRRGDRILSNRRLGHVLLGASVMAIGTLGVLAGGIAWGSGSDAEAEAHALAMAFTTFVFFQIFNAFNARSEDATVFRRESLRNGKLWAALAVVAVLQVLAVHVDPVPQTFGTADLAAADWLVVLAVSSTVLWAEEARKLLGRGRAARRR